MKLLLLLSLLLSSLTGFSQLSMIEAASFEASSRDSIIGSNFEVANVGTDTETFYWDIVRSADMPEEWEFSICDQILCFPVGQESSDCDEPSFQNILAPGESVSYYKVGLYPYGVAGTHTVEFRLTSVCGNVTENDVIATQVITYNITGGSSTKNLQDDKSILIYPNPTADRFQINEDADISDIAIYNIVGKQIFTDSHYVGKSHNISDLDEGIYLVRMMNPDNDVVKVLRLTKE